jgi:hypothetical protein
MEALGSCMLVSRYINASIPKAEYNTFCIQFRTQLL